MTLSQQSRRAGGVPLESCRVSSSKGNGEKAADPQALLFAAANLPSTCLHDELLYPHGVSDKSRLPKPKASAATEDYSKNYIHVSRPCYRCIMYMHNVGIKRVFWTNSCGQWEGGKVRGMVDALDGSKSGTDSDSLGPGVSSMFVTKHEVLMLRRVMGERDAKTKPGGPEGLGMKRKRRAR